jgi:hypothetical protein
MNINQLKTISTSVQFDEKYQAQVISTVVNIWRRNSLKSEEREASLFAVTNNGINKTLDAVTYLVLGYNS